MAEMLNGLQSRVSQMKWEEDYTLHATMTSVVQSPWFEPTMIGAVVLNALLIGVQIDHPDLLGHFASHVLAVAFNVVYTFEIFSKVYIFGFRGFIKVPYNVFALFVTSAAWVEISANSTMEFITHFEEARALQDKFHMHFRNYFTADLVQIVQLGRIIRLGVVFPTLGKLLSAFVASFTAIGWVFSLIMLWFYIVACSVTVFIGHRHFEDAGPEGDELRGISESFGTILHSMFTLFELMALEGWPSYVRPFTHEHWIYVPFLLVFIFVANFFFLNLLTAVVVETMLKKHGEEDAEDAGRQEAKRIYLSMRLIRRLYALNADDDRGEVVLLKDLQAWANPHAPTRDAEIAALLEQLGWSYQYLDSLSRLCDHDATGEVTLTQLRSLFEDCGGVLNMNGMVKFQQHLACRVDYLDSIMQEVLQAVAKVGSSHA
jgi:voltage-gated sodium channel